MDMCDRLELERQLNAPLTDLRRPPKWNGHHVDWHEWTESQSGALHCYCDGVGPEHIWQPWWCNGFVEDTDLFLHLERCPVCGLTQVWENMRLLHGHTHANTPHEFKNRNEINVGLDAWDMRPVSEVELVRMFQEN